MLLYRNPPGRGRNRHFVPVSTNSLALDIFTIFNHTKQSCLSSTTPIHFHAIAIPYTVIARLENEQHIDLLQVQNDDVSLKLEKKGGDEEHKGHLRQDCIAQRDVSCIERTEYTEELKANATSIFHNYMRKCTCNPTCSTKFSDPLHMKFRFSAMKQTEHINIVRAILYPLTAPPDIENELSDTSSTYAQNRNCKRIDNAAAPRATTVYAFKCKRVYRHAFSAIVQLNTKNINVHAGEIAKTNCLRDMVPIYLMLENEILHYSI